MMCKCIKLQESLGEKWYLLFQPKVNNSFKDGSNKDTFCGLKLLLAVGCNKKLLNGRGAYRLKRRICNDQSIMKNEE
jgi:hypothetical protein